MAECIISTYPIKLIKLYMLCHLPASARTVSNTLQVSGIFMFLVVQIVIISYGKLMFQIQKEKRFLREKHYMTR